MTKDEQLEEKSFDESLKELEEIVDQLEQGDIPLEKALDEFQKGVKISRSLKKTLNEADELLTKIVDEEGNETVFEANENNTDNPETD